MRLIIALRIFNPSEPTVIKAPRLALTGAGGKSSALFCLGREIAETSPSQPVILTTTTHLSIGQTLLADHHFEVQGPEDIQKIASCLPAGVLLITGARADKKEAQSLEDKIAGPGQNEIEELYELANERQLPLLIEADGSRRRPLKAPASYEPVLPDWIEHVVVVAGLSGINQPLNETWVHRSERFAKISGLNFGDSITPEALVQVLVHPEGGIWNLPPSARRSILLNQASTAELAATGNAIAGDLLRVYERVVIADLASPGAQQPETADQVVTVHERIAGVILAAGSSQRMGQAKQLLIWKGEPLVRQVARTALAAGLDPVILVVGAFSEEVVAAVQGLPLQIVYNPAWETGQSSSLVSGLTAAQEQAGHPGIGGAVFLLADQPQIPAPLIRNLVEIHAQNLPPLVAPQAGGRRGNPVLFDRVTFPDLLALRGDVGGRSLFSKYPATWLTWLDERILFDVDTSEDYDRLLQSGD